MEGLLREGSDNSRCQGILCAGEADLEDIQQNLAATPQFPSITKSWKKGQKLAALDYLIYADQCNVLVEYADAWKLSFLISALPK